MEKELVYNVWAYCRECGCNQHSVMIKRTEYYLIKKVVIKYECQYGHKFSKNFKLK